MKSFRLILLILVSAFLNQAQAEAAELAQNEERLVQLMTPYAKERGLMGINITKTTDFPDNFGSMEIKGYMIEIALGSEVRRLHPRLSEDVFSYVLCHELGHFFAGAPLYKNEDSLSTEGQSDYWAAAVCLKKLFRDFPQATVKNLDPFIKKNCDIQFRDKSEQLICYRSAQAGFDFMTEMHYSVAKHSPVEAKGFYRKPDFTKKETHFLDGYPTLQCRAETVAAGAFCNTSEKRWNLRIPNWSCETALTKRPSCWFTN